VQKIVNDFYMIGSHEIPLGKVTQKAKRVHVNIAANRQSNDARLEIFGNRFSTFQFHLIQELLEIKGLFFPLSVGISATARPR
jgi:hypothetical protein